MIVQLTSTQRRALRAAAHSLNPVVAIAQAGLSPSVLAEIDRSLSAHELIKIRVYGEERAMREGLLHEVCEALDAAPVQHIGNILVIWREKPEAAPAPAKPAPAGKRVRKAEKVERKAAPRRK
ncbi:MAG: ribosome assembly RNA-binding protein YhbY [Pseudomonadota bacterium]|jgi:putative YhbY family RNA-binding protein